MGKNQSAKLEIINKFINEFIDLPVRFVAW